MHVDLQVSPAKSPVPVVSDVTAIHDLAEQVAQVRPRYLGVGFQVVVEHVDTDC